MYRSKAILDKVGHLVSVGIDFRAFGIYVIYRRQYISVHFLWFWIDYENYTDLLAMRDGKSK